MRQSGNMWQVEECIISRKITPEEALTKMVAACFDPKKTNEILELLSDELPLGEFNMLHAKRVRKARDLNNMVEILICPENRLSDRMNSKLQSLLDSALHQRIVQVATYPANTPVEHNEWNPHWPISFHINELERQRQKGIPIEESENVINHWQQVIQDHDEVVNKLGWKEEDGGCGGLLVNPVTSQVICTVADALTYELSLHAENPSIIFQNPLLCATLLCVNYISLIAREAVPGKEKLAEGHYLCTGLDLYLYNEPDMMASMGLVHSRIRRVYIGHIVSDGALVSGEHHIHALRSLNHHYRVFQVQRKTSSDDTHIVDT